MSYSSHPRYWKEKKAYSRRVVAKLYPEIQLEGSNGKMDHGESVFYLYDKVMPYNGDIYHEYREKSKSDLPWQDNACHADWWLFVSQTKNGNLTIFVALSEMQLWEKDKEMVAIPAKAPISMGYIIPREEILHEVRRESGGRLFQYKFTDDLIHQFREAHPLFCKRCGEPVYLEEKETSKRYIDAITLKPHILTCPREERGGVTSKEMGIERWIAHHRKRGVTLRGPDGQIIDWLWCLSTWDKLGRPVVYAAPGDPFYDLSLYMYPEKISPRQLQGIAAWLEEHKK